MALLAGTLYDPGTAVTNKALTANIAMAPIDTSNLRHTFVGPPNGYVGVKIRVPVHGSSTLPHILLGILEGSTVKLRMVPQGHFKSGTSASQRVSFEIKAVVPVTPGTSYTWDAAYGVENSTPSSNIKYGGPNNTTTNDAYGGVAFEIWEVPDLIAAILYDPSSAATKSTASLLAMTAFDTSNLRITFTCPQGNGTVLGKIKTMTTKADSAQADILLGILDGATVKARQSAIGNNIDIAAIGNRQSQWAEFIISGLTPGTQYSFDAAYGVEIVGSGGTPNIYYGGPNNTSGGDGYGAIGYELWDASYRAGSSFFGVM